MRNARGFTLLEVIVALAILGIGLGVVFQGLAQGLRLRGEGAENVRSAVLAERLVGGLASRKEAPAEPESGEEGGLRWSVERVPAPVRPAGVEEKPAPAEGLVEVRIAIVSAAGRRWEIATLLPEKKAARQ